MNKTTLSLCKYSSKSISASSLWLRHIWWAYQERQHKGNTQEHVHINWPHTSHFSFQTRLRSPQRGPVLTNLGSEFNLILPQVNTRTKVESVLSLNNIQQSVSPVWGEAARSSAPYRGVSYTRSDEPSSVSSSDCDALWLSFSDVEEAASFPCRPSSLSLALLLSWTNSWISTGSRRNLSWYSWSRSLCSYRGEQDTVWFEFSFGKKYNKLQ